MSVTVLVPWQGGCPYRERALGWVRGKYHWPVHVVEVPNFTKARAINRGVQDHADPILVIADADCWCESIARAVEAVERGAPWAMPHRKVHRLSEAGSEQFITTGRGELVEPPYVGVKGGGIVAVRRDVLLDVPWDERFEGWGRQDLSWRAAMTTFHGNPWRGDADLIHLWHPPAPRHTRRQSLSRESEALYARYRRARGDERAIRDLLKGAR